VSDITVWDITAKGKMQEGTVLTTHTE